ncbi:di-heme oxidoredictase family protein [Neptunomonas qingdaonensis]|uniref:CxxC motif-containing protein, DUF1111 family n=1 Tax=Neptunomonas qingdaonensis TaxID=1045558 RepID=A0A1I2LLQ6_9GAMM|nr:di-heme oxidoredictase family protein [Neptunomonas qingdaonensis]SFF79458.1 CxxC motif-containing protein, DUF1111 family [Neptunomonas qingdaonensis]
MKNLFFLAVSIVAIAALTATLASQHWLFSQAYASEQQPEPVSEQEALPVTLSAPWNAFSSSFLLPAEHLSSDERMSFALGSSLFSKIWVSSPSSTTASDGLGPLFNARSCHSCHIRNGRGRPTTTHDSADAAISMILRLSIPAQTQQPTMQAPGQQSVLPEPVYGTQLQDFSVQGIAAEGRIKVRYTELPVSPLAGEKTATISLRTPEYDIKQLSYGPLHPDTRMSARVAPPIIGLGLLEAIPEAVILASEDPDDLDNDGISGRVNRVWDMQRQNLSIGRFGWKAGHPMLQQQNASALHADIGISSPMFPDGSGDCTAAQTHCQMLPNGNSTHLDNAEASAQMLDLFTFYTRNLAVPGRRNVNAPEVIRGEKLFTAIGCQRCHTPAYIINNGSSESPLKQTISPYTDLLLHDMGEGLADNRDEFLATGREWRTAPLWGIGLTKSVSGHTQFLHDGRARNLAEAIIWHGGEADASKKLFMQLSPQNRHALISFLESL